MSTSTPLKVSLKNPFPGLRPFREDEEHLFFGRESQVDKMVDKLAKTRYLAVVGTSGSGKSSLVSCGLKPALHRGLMSSAGTSWRMVQFRPGGSPLRAMARAFAEKSGMFANFQPGSIPLLEIIEATLRMSSLGLADLFEYAHFDPGVNLLVVVDQFEEIFRFGKAGSGSRDTYGVSGEAIALVNLLLEAHSHSTYPIYIVQTMRSDFLGECSQFDGLPEVINEGQYLVPRMTREERRSAIAGPVAVAGGELSPVLLTRLVNDVGENPDQLSILQHAINRTWAWWQEEGRGGPLSLDHYENDKVGTMAHALDHHAEEAYAELTTERRQKICERAFKALTDTGTDARGIRRPLPLKTLCEVIGVDQEEVVPVLDVFRAPDRSFLMPPAAESLETDTVIDITHEILMRVWGRLKKWADEEAQSANMYRRVAETAQLYAVDKAALWRDPDLRTALEWEWKEAPNAAWAQLYRTGFKDALSFLAASKQIRDSEMAEAEFTRRWRNIRPFLAAFVVFVFLSSSWRLHLAPKLLLKAEKVFKIEVVRQPDVVRDVESRLENAAGVVSDGGGTLNPPANSMKKSPAVGRPHAPDESPTTSAVDGLLEFLILLFASPVICIPGYVALAFGAKRAYRYLAFARIAERMNLGEQAPKEKPAHEVATAGGAVKVRVSAAEATEQEERELASLWLRLGAGSIDSAALVMLGLFSAFTMVIVLAIAEVTFHFKTNDAADAWIGFIFLVSVPVLDFLYQSLMMQSRWNGTLGELACGITVVDRHGQHLRFGRFAARYFAKWLSWLTLSIGFFVQLFTSRRQALHDLLAGTIVVRRRRSVAYGGISSFDPIHRIRIEVAG